MRSGVTVSRPFHRHEADLARLHLEAAGIRAWLADEWVVAIHPLLANAVGGIKVVVAEGDAERARAVLGRLVVVGERCLSCGGPMAEEERSCARCGWTFQSVP
jgi:hypothetical protein